MKGCGFLAAWPSLAGASVLLGIVFSQSAMLPARWPIADFIRNVILDTGGAMPASDHA